jgi:tetratricopeptide (TPR) repeat protein
MKYHTSSVRCSLDTEKSAGVLIRPSYLLRRLVGKSNNDSFSSVWEAQAKLRSASDTRKCIAKGMCAVGTIQLEPPSETSASYWAIFWIDASTIDSIQRCFAQIAILLQVDEDIHSVKRVLTNTSQPWLLVFDNADDPNLSLTPYFPAGDRGDILITSRNPGCRQYNTVGSQEIGRLSADDSVSLLIKTAYGETTPADTVYEDGKKVIEALGCLAFAIAQAGAYTRETSCTLKEYFELYEKRKKEVLGYLPKHSGTDYGFTVYTTWQVSLDMIESIGDTTSNHALELLKLLCFYHHDHIPVEMLYNAWHSSEEDPMARDSSLWPDAFSDFLEYQQSVRASVALLASFSLITRDSDALLSFHPLIHDWCRDRMSKVDQQTSCRRAISLLTRSVKWEFKTADYAFRRSLVSHVHACLRFHDYRNQEFDDNKWQNWLTLGLILGENGWTSEALQLTEQVVQLQKAKLGEDHPDTIQSMHSLAIYYSKAGRRQEALQLTEQVVQFRKAKLGEDHPDTLRSMHNLAIGYSEAGRRPEALQLTEQVVQLQKAKLGEDHPDTIQSMHSLAIHYSEAGRLSEALQLTEQVVQLQKAKLGEDHPDTLHSMHSLAGRYSEAGRRPEALQLTEQVVQLRKAKLGEDHPATLRSMHNLAIWYSEAGRRSEALRLAEQVERLRKVKLGEDHPDTLHSMHSLAIHYSEAGRRSEALQLTEQVVQLRKAKLGEDHPNTLHSMHNLAVRYSEAGRRSEALRLMEQVVQFYKAKLGEDHPDTLHSIHSLAVEYGEVGRRSEALQLTEQVVQLRKAKLGEDHPDTLHSIHNLAIEYSEVGRRSEALQMIGQVVQLRKAKLGEDHPDTLHSMRSMANIAKRDNGNSQQPIVARQSRYRLSRLWRLTRS